MMIPPGGELEVGEGNQVTAAEASILRDFLLVQADKHGHDKFLTPFRKLRGEEQDVDAVQKEVKMELVVEEVIKSELNYIELPQHPQQLNVTSANCVTLTKRETNGTGVVTHNNVTHQQDTNGHVDLLVAAHDLTVASSGGVRLTERHDGTRGGISVIQKAPPRFVEVKPRLFLERRSQEHGQQSPGGAQQAFELQIVDQGELVKFEEQKATATNGGGCIRRGRKSNQQQSDHLVCEVCGERAGKHSYYGGQVCPSCRAFFRRSVQSRYNETFTCTKGSGGCLVNLLTRKNCQYCRYQKCLAAGMRPSWILSDEERLRRFHGRSRGRVTQQQLQQQPQIKTEIPSAPELQQQQEPMSPRSQLMDPYNDFSRQDIEEVLKYGEIIRCCCTKRHDDIEPHLLTDILQVTLHGTSLTYQTAQQLDRVLDRRARSCFSLFQEFQSLSRADQSAVLENNLPLVHRFRQAVFLGNPSLTWRDQVAILVGEDKLAEAEQHLPTDLSSSKGEKPGKFQYRHLFSSPWCQSSEMENKQIALMEEIAHGVNPNDKVEVILLTMIVAFNPDFLELENRPQVEEIQLKFVLMLQGYLRSYFGAKQAATKLVKALMLPAITRQILELTRKRLII